MGRTSPGCESAPCVQYMYSIIDHPTKCVSKENQTRETKTAVLAESVLATAGDSHPVDLCIRCAPEAVASRRARGAPPSSPARGSAAAMLECVCARTCPLQRRRAARTALWSRGALPPRCVVALLAVAARDAAARV